MRQFFVWLCGLAVLILSACGGTSAPTLEPTLTDTPTPNTVLVTPDATRMSLNLPPTWTPTFTPTITDTPTITPTYTVTPSLTPIDRDLMCQNFHFNVRGIDSQIFSTDDTITVSYGIDEVYNYAFVGVVLEHDDLDDIVADVMPGGADYVSTFVVKDFPIAGEWNYRTGVFLTDGSEMLCRQAGTFIIEAGAIPTKGAVTIPTALAVPSRTPQPDLPELQPCILLCSFDDPQ